jgi:hypothetical protein
MGFLAPEAGLTLETINQEEEHRQDCIAGAPEISKETPMSTAEPYRRCTAMDNISVHSTAPELMQEFPT